MKKLYALAFLAALSACSPGPQLVPGLSQDARARVDQNLRNGRVPSPAEVAKDAIPLEQDACERFRASLPPQWLQETMDVPENPADPAGAKIKIFYYGQLKTGSVPTIFFNGGPGSDSHNSAADLNRRDSFFDPQGQVSFLFIDQRGTGCSDFYPQGNSSDVLNRLRFYGSRGIVSDSEYVRRKLMGDRPWIAFGQSYGAFIAHRYAIVAPQSLKAVLAHANAIDSDGYTRIKNRIAAQLRVMNTYLSEFPDDRKLLEALKAALTPTTCFVNSDRTETICGYEVLEIIAGRLLGFTDHWLTIHQWIGMIADESGIRNDGMARFLATFAFGESNPLNSERWANAVIGWVDRDVPPLDTEYCRAIAKDLLVEGIDLSKSLSDECMYALQVPVQNSTAADDPIRKLPRDLMTVDTLFDSLRAHPELSFFLYSGAKDPYVPVENFKEEVAKIGALQNVRYTEFGGTGHDGFETEPRIWADLIRMSK